MAKLGGFRSPNGIRKASSSLKSVAPKGPEMSASMGMGSIGMKKGGMVSKKKKK